MADSEHGPSAPLLARHGNSLFHSHSIHPFFINTSIHSSCNEEHEDVTVLVKKKQTN